MKQIKKVHIFLTIWIFGWSYLCIDQVSQSIDYINMTMRSVRKVQNDCAILKICSDDKSILNNTYEGFIFDKIVRNDMLYQYMVYLKQLIQMILSHHL